jgi:sec-independent protein translocase protein TatC
MRILLLPVRLLLAIFRGFRHFFQEIYELFTVEPEDAPIGDAFARTVENPSGLVEHVNALRRHLLRSVLAVLISSILMFTFNHRIIEFLARPLPGGLDALTAIDITEPVGTVFRVSILVGFAFALPYIVFEVWLFFAPGVSRRTRLTSLVVIPLATIFFMIGMAFAYYVLLPPAVRVLTQFLPGVETSLRPSTYLSFVTSILFWMGLFFELPLVVYLLASFGFLNAQILKSQWRLAVVVMTVLAAMITPTTDPINMALVLAPMLFLYGLSILLAGVAQSRRARRMEAQL